MRTVSVSVLQTCLVQRNKRGLWVAQILFFLSLLMLFIPGKSTAWELFADTDQPNQQCKTRCMVTVKFSVADVPWPAGYTFMSMGTGLQSASCPYLGCRTYAGRGFSAQMPAAGGVIGDAVKWFTRGPVGEYTVAMPWSYGTGKIAFCIYAGRLLPEHGEDIGWLGVKVACSNTIPPTEVPSSCMINSAADITVNFGSIERTALSSSTTESALTIAKTLTASCTGQEVVNFSVKMDSNPAVWNREAIRTSNGDLGVVTRWNSNVITNGSTQAMRVDGSASVKLTFTPIRPAAVAAEAVATGPFSASATLIVTQQ